MTNFVPDIKTYKKCTEISRHTILCQLLESSNPEFVLECILNKCNTNDLVNYAYYTGMFKNLVNEAYKKEKLARGTGKGSLKDLVGASDNATLSDNDWVEIGKKIALMRDFNRRDYVGMINFLHASCDIYEEVHRNLHTLGFESLNNNFNRSSQLFEYNSPYFQNSISSIDDVTKLCAYALSRLSDVKCMEIEDDIFDDDAKDAIEDFNDNEGEETVPEIEITPNLKDQYGNPITGNDNITETKGYRGIKGKGPGDMVNIRHERGNGRGGLKEFVGVPEANDLTKSDMKRIAKKIVQNANPEECRQALDNVNYLGSACKSFYNIKRGYMIGIQAKGKNRTAKNGYGKRAAKKNKILNGNTLSGSNKIKYGKKGKPLKK